MLHTLLLLPWKILIVRFCGESETGCGRAGERVRGRKSSRFRMGEMREVARQ